MQMVSGALGSLGFTLQLAVLMLVFVIVLMVDT